MLFLASFNWGWLLGAGLLGFAVGWIAVVRHSEGLSPLAMRWAIAATLLMLALALARLLPGRPGYWLDLGLVMGACYVIGGVAGSWLRERVVMRASRAAPDSQSQ